jgi:hypothetical protein
MHLPVPTSLLFLFLCVAASAPLASRWSGWWMPYYGALLVCWSLITIAALRRATREDRNAQTRRRPLPDANDAEAVEAQGTPARHPIAAPRTIIVARDKVVLYDRIRREQLRDEVAKVIADRRGSDRRRRLELYLPDRRLRERRHYDIAPLLLRQGWADVTSPKG